MVASIRPQHYRGPGHFPAVHGTRRIFFIGQRGPNAAGVENETQQTSKGWGIWGGAFPSPADCQSGEQGPGRSKINLAHFSFTARALWRKEQARI